MARRRSHTGLTIIFVVVAVLLVAGLGVYFYNPFEQAMLTPSDQCYVTSSGETSSAYPCQGGKCFVQGVSECNDPTGQQSVIIFRTNGIINSDRNVKFSYMYRADQNPTWYPDGKDAWIVVNLDAVSGKTSLARFEWDGYGGSQGPCSYRGTILKKPDGKPLVTPDGYQMYYDTRSAKLYVYDGSCHKHTFIYSSRSDIDDTLTSVVKYADKSQEILAGTVDAFFCETPAYVNSQQVEMASTNKQEEYRTNIIQLASGQTFNYADKIIYSVVDDSKACGTSKCNDQKTGYYACSSGKCPTLSTSLTKCGSGEYCSQSGAGGAASCGAPFDTDGEIKTGRTAGETISFEYMISSPTVKEVTITYKLVNIEDRSTTLDIKPNVLTTLPTSKKTISFAGQSVGDYEIIVEKTYSGGEVADEIYTFTIGAELTTNVFVPLSPLTGTNIIAGSPFYVDVQALENTNDVTELAEFITKATITDVNNQDIPLTVPVGQIKSTPNGQVMRYTFTVEQIGKFKFESYAKKYGVPSEAKTRVVDIKPSKISISFTNMGYMINAQPGSHTVTFETKDPFDEYIDVTYKAKLIPAGAAQGTGDIDITSYITKQGGTDSVGKYEFTYNFETGSYVIEIYQVKAAGYTIESSTKSASLNIDPTAVTKECVSSDECVTGKVCIDNKCVNKEPPYTLYAILFVVAIIVIVLIIVIIKMARRKAAPSVPIYPGM